MTAEEILRQLEQGATLEGPHWTEPVRVLTAKARGTKVEVQAVGLRTKRLWTKLLKVEEFGESVKITQAGQLAALDGNPTHFRLAAEAHRIRLAFQYDPHFAVSVSQVDPLPHQMDAVYTHLLTQPRIRFLIADDPGAGKTIMARADDQGIEISWFDRADPYRHASQPHSAVAARTARQIQ